MSHNAAKPARSQRNNLIAAIATIAVCDIAFGLTFPLMSVLLEERGVPAWMALAVLGDEFRGVELISGAAAFAATWGIGGIIGPPIAGAALDSFGVDALPAFFIVLYASLAVLLFACGGRLVRAPA
jgi:hypothetical protein